MTDISESGIEAALRAGDFSVDSKTKAKMRRMLKAYLPFHPPASREEGLREALQYVASYAETRREHHAPDEVANAFDDIAKRARRALIPTKPEAKEDGWPWEISADAWRQVTERIVKETERVYGPGPVIDAVRSALQSKKPE